MKLKKKFEIFVISIIIIACSNLVLAENSTNQSINVKIEIILPENITMGLVYDSLFKITNLNYVKGVDSKINVTVNYNLTKLDTLIYSASFNRIVNSFSTSATGFLHIDTPGTYVLCGQAENSSSCKQLNVIDPFDITCNASLETSIGKNVFDNHERLEIENKILFNNDEEHPFIIEYWIEDLFGAEIKKKVNTTNNNDKSFTPDIDEKSEVYFLKSRLVYVGCNNLFGQTQSETMFAVRNQEYKEIIARKVEIESLDKNTTTKEIKNANIYSFYTRTKNYKPEINIYANLKGSGEATVIFHSDVRQQIRKLELPAKPVFLGEAKPGSNKYTLELYVDDELIDSRDLIINLAGEIPLKKPEINATKNVSTLKKPVVIPKAIVVQEIISNGTTQIVANDRVETYQEQELQIEKLEEVFESTSQKEKNVAPTIGIGVLILIAIGVALFKK